MKKYILRLVAELVVIVLVPLIFHVVANRLHAGMIAGVVFIVLGFYVIAPGLKSMDGRKALSFWAGLLHLGAAAFPLLISRLMQSDVPFEDVRIMGMTGPEFHRFSTAVYTVMLVATVIDIGLAYRRQKIAAQATQ